MFMRNRGRSSKQWEKLEKATKDLPKVVTTDSDSEEEHATPKKGRKAKRKANPSPWRGDTVLKRLLSEPLDLDDDDDDIEFIGSSTTPRKGAARKRARTRSRSITPPPELPRHQLQHARALVQQTLNVAPRAASPTHQDDDSDDAVFSNPELARLAATRAPTHFASSPPPPEGTDTIQLRVKWQAHPLNTAMEAKEDPWVFKMNRDDNFRDLFEAVAEEASVQLDNLFMSYNNRRIFPSVTPTGLQIWGEADLVACNKITYEYLRANPIAASNSLSAFDASTSAPDALSDTDAPSPSQDYDAQDTDGADSDAEDDTFKLILRSSITTKDITLTVRPTTKCGAIVKAYLKKAGVADQYPGVFGAATPKKGKGKKAASAPEKDPRLCVDGDRMGNDVDISEADLEDGDLVELVGL
ncbi:hypothetical protein DXG03_003260 [Asterophora parasitica]|uniref:Rad60/SUMO-like domain-containing protein n=1 Tax=Asterophora parasitica TaxID=117018 RepID=A0A9P7GFQ7_9AGAR|nr:hypothetical protein DXG03_003260 [Asterophora parasitica]